MVLPTNGFTLLNKQSGRPLRLRYYTETIGSVWDDDRTLAKSGNDIYTSGIILRINKTEGSDDQILLEQGRIKYNDTKFYISGTFETTSGVRVFTISISGLDTVYKEITPGVNIPTYYGENIYKLTYGRFLDTGSL